MIPYPICVLDLETCGTNAATDPIIEIGMVLLDETLTEIAAFESVAYLDPDLIVGLDTVVQQMHERNGLLAEATSLTAPTLATVESNALAWIAEHTSSSSNHIALAGSGVSHFDRRFLIAQMPQLEKRFAYWSLDVGMMRRMCDVAGVGYPPYADDGKPHRGLGDALIHANELRWQVDQLRQINLARDPA